MKLMINFETAVIAIIFLTVWENPEADSNTRPQELRINANVQNCILTNQHNIKLDASKTNHVNGKKRLWYSWVCKEFPQGQKPKINQASNPVSSVESLMAGRYNFQLTVKDDFGHLSIANFPIEVFQDSLAISAKNVQAANQFVYCPAVLFTQVFIFLRFA